MPSMPRSLMILACAACLALPARAESIKVLVQSSPLAGFQFYAGRELWEEMKAGDALALVQRFPDARDRCEPSGKRRRDLAVDVRVGFTEQSAPLGVADDGVLSARFARARAGPA